MGMISILVLVIIVSFNGRVVNSLQCPEIKTSQLDYLPDKNCSRYWKCVDGIPHLNECPDGHYFNLSQGICEFKENFGCSTINITTFSISDGSNEECLKINLECPVVDGKYPVYSALPNCSQFCQCSNGKPYLHNCPSNLSFNPSLNVCDWPNNAGCVGGYSSENSTDNSNDNNTNSETESVDGTGNTSDECLEINLECPAVDRRYPVYGALPNCSQFCQCSNGKLYLHNCPSNLHFNPSLNVCDWPKNAGCVGSNSSGNSTENPNDNNSNSENESVNGTGSTSNECLKINLECPAVDGKYPVYSALPNCSQFCQCSNGKPYLHNCPSNLHFNPSLNVCDWPKNAGFVSGNSSGNGTDNSNDSNTNSENESVDGTGNTIIECLEINLECSAVDGKYPVYSALPNCSQFCQCSNGKPYLHNCPSDLHFNPNLNICDWPEHAGCIDGNSSGNSTDNSNGNNSNSENESVNGTEKASNECLEINLECPAVDGKYPVYSVLPNCSQFCQCSNGKPYLHNCPSYLHFNPSLNVCDWPKNAGCVGGNSSENSTDNSNDSNTNSENESVDGTGNTNIECLEINLECPAVDGKDPVYSAMPNCSQFCQCSNGKPYLHNCPSDLHFNPSLNICDWPKHAGCVDGNSPGNSTDNSNDNNSNSENESVNGTGSTSNECLKINLECPAIDGKYPVYSALPNCSQFCQCSNGNLYLHNCPSDLHFNPSLNICDWPKHAGCVDGNSSGNSTDNSNGNNSNSENESVDGTENASNKCLEINLECPAVDGKYPVYSALPNCSQFCQCSNGKPYLHNCPSNHHFNPSLNVCDWPKNAGCVGGNSSENSTDNSNDNNTNSENESVDGTGNTNIECLEINLECPAVDGKNPVYSAMPNCSQFCQCSNGKPYLHNCPSDPHFNPSLNVCDWPKHAGCVGGNSSGNSTDNSNDNNSNSENESVDGTGNASNECLEINLVCPAVDEKYPVYSALPNCSQFCQCSNGKPYLHNCPSNLQFNPSLNVCDWPKNAGCVGGNSSGNSTDNSNDSNTNSENESVDGTENTSIECLEINLDCPAVDGKYPVYSALPNCSQFCQCSNGKPYLHNCPSDLHFNPSLNVCDWPKHAGCVGGNSSGNSTDNSNGNNSNSENESVDGTENASNECLEINLECPAVDGKYPVYSALPNCSQFCQCSNGKPYLHNCPSNLHFNPSLNVCDWPKNAGCVGSNSSENSTDNSNDNNTNSENESVDGTGNTNIECFEINLECPAVDGKDPVYSALPNCSQFCQCSNGKPYLHNCPSDLHFNPSLNVCDWPKHAGCVGGNSSENSTDNSNDNNTNSENESLDGTGNTNIECLEINLECPAVDGKDPVYSALPNCSQFCQCSNGKPYLHNCPSDLHFNPSLNVCDWPKHAGCVDGNSSGNSTDNSNDNNSNSENESVNGTGSTSNECLKINLECPAIDGKYPVYSALPNCSQFCQCSNGKPYLHNCPSNLHFNPSLNVCDWPKNAGCVGSNSSENCTDNSNDNNTNSENESVDGTGNTNIDCLEINLECPAVDGKDPVYSALPNCSQFCQCSNGKPYLHNCPSDLHFNPSLNVCDWPKHAGCVGGNSSENSTDNLNDNNTNSENESVDGTGNTNIECLEINLECPAVDGKDPVYSALPNCSQFCQCSNGKPYLHNCPSDLHFNPSLNVCDWPKHAGCVDGNSSGNSTDNSNDNNSNSENESVNGTGSTSNECLKINLECPAIDGKYPVYSALPNCSQFCQCSNGKPYLHNCPSDLHFNPSLNVCDWPKHAGCVGGNSPGNSTDNSNDNNSNSENESVDGTENASNECLEIHLECPAVDGKYPVYSALPNCSQFCQCSNGKPYLHNCPSDLHFNPSLNVCDWPKHAGCVGGTSSGNSTDNSNDNNSNSENESVDGTGNASNECLEINLECPAVDGKYPVYSALPNCSQFCQCSNGKLYLHNCPSNLHFNPILNVCDWPQHAGCIADNSFVATFP